MTEHHSQPTQPQIEIMSIYVKDISVESPMAPKIFTESWKPEVQLDLNIAHRTIDTDLHEVTLSVTVRTKKQEHIALLVEIQQAGVFRISGFEKDQKDHLLGVYFPSLLYPYARETVASLFQRASFAPLHLSPVNFEVLYQQKKQAEIDKADGTKGKH